MIIGRIMCTFACWISVLFVAIAPQFAEGQLIGNQTIGSSALSLSQQRAAAAAAPSSSIGGVGGASNAIGSIGNRLQVNNTRFVRGNRNRQDFVGSNRSDQTGFVGSGQALGVGRVSTAAETLRLETTKTKINRPLPQQPAKGMYYPRLEVDVGGEQSPEDAIQEVAAGRVLSDRVAQFSDSTARVTLAGRTAILRGRVSSNRAAELLVQILSFEPGIDRVINKLKTP